MSFQPYPLLVNVYPPGNSRVAPAAAGQAAPAERLPSAGLGVLAGLPDRRRGETEGNPDNDSDIDVGCSADAYVVPVAPRITEDRVQLIRPLIYDERWQHRQVCFDDVRSSMADLNIVMMDAELLAICACLRRRDMQLAELQPRLRRSTNASDLLTQLNLQPPGQLFSVGGLKSLIPGRDGDIQRSIRLMYWCGTLKNKRRFGVHERSDLHITTVDFFRKLDAHRHALRTTSAVFGVPLRDRLL